MDSVSHHQTVVFIISHVGSCSFLILLQSVLLFISLEYAVQFIRPTALSCESNNCHLEEAKGSNKYVVKLKAMNICFLGVEVATGSRYCQILFKKKNKLANMLIATAACCYCGVCLVNV